MTIPNLVVSVSALPKSGKNHFACTAPDPIRIYCFNGGADFVATKFPKKKIEVANFSLPIVEDVNMRWALPLWEKFRGQYQKDIDSGAFATYVFDTSTEIENICQQSVLEEQQDVAEGHSRAKQKLATTEYLARNLRMKALFDIAKNSGVNLITLQYLKEEWIKERGKDRAEPTGELVLDGWKRTESQADINLEMSARLKGQKPVSVTKIVSNRFDRDLDGKTFEDLTFDDLVAVFFAE